MPDQAYDPPEPSMQTDQQGDYNDETTEKEPSVKAKVIRGSVWTIFGHGSNQVIRLGSNLVLTRLLFPEAFGLMSLVQVFMIGLELFSDVGIIPSIIQNKRGNDPKFLNTAWTIQVFRGLALWICSCALAIPAARFYHEPMLGQLLPVVGINAALAGLNSTKLATANRKIELGRLTALELGSYVLGVLSMIAGAWVTRSVWSLVVGGFITALAKLLLSHFYLPGERNRFYWDREAFGELQRFGRWIFVSTMLGFFVGQGDRLVVGRLMDVTFLGIYGIALMLSRAFEEIIMQVTNKVLFPFYSELYRENPKDVYRILRKNRIILISLSWAVSLFFILFGQLLIDFLYDERYTQAGRMLQILAISGLISSLYTSYGNVLLARGQTFALTLLLAINAATKFGGMMLGGYLGGQNGIIIGLAFSSWVFYPAEIFFYVRARLWQPEVDIPAFIGATIVAALFFYFT
ncbi:oligosaccharide flippase family protein [Phormidium tenue FACHB-886]|nr:oligosaccharide flippase family protein [Phormidium tenue FACHB-886]